MTSEQIIDEIKIYIDDKTYNYALLIDGEWGSGKTYFWNNKVKNKIDSMQINGKRYTTIYMSLYGISNLEDISKKIFIETTQLMDKNLKKFMKRDIPVIKKIIKLKHLRKKSRKVSKFILIFLLFQ